MNTEFVYNVFLKRLQRGLRNSNAKCIILRIDATLLSVLACELCVEAASKINIPVVFRHFRFDDKNIDSPINCNELFAPYIRNRYNEVMVCNNDVDIHLGDIYRASQDMVCRRTHYPYEQTDKSIQVIRDCIVSMVLYNMAYTSNGMVIDNVSRAYIMNETCEYDPCINLVGDLREESVRNLCTWLRDKYAEAKKTDFVELYDKLLGV